MSAARAMIVILLAAAAAQAAAVEPRLTQLVHTSWTRRDGLPVASVTGIAQSSDGDLWLATPDGLVRFDGRRFERFHSGNVEGLDNHVFTTILADPSTGALWVGGHGGLFAWRDGLLEPVLDAGGAQLAAVNQLARGTNGELWISHGDGVAVLRADRLEPFLLPGGEPAPRADDLLVETDGTVWLAAGDLLRVKGGELRRFGTADGLPAPATAVAIGGGERWVGTRGRGVLRWSGDRFESLPGTDGSTAFRLAPIGDALWIASFGRGLMRWMDGTLETLGSRDGLASDDVFTAIADDGGRIWFGSQSGGLHRLHVGDFVTFGPPEGLGHPNVAAVYQDRGGKLWAGTSGGGLWRRDGGSWAHLGRDQGLGSEAIMTIGEDGAGTLWVGTGDAGVFRARGDGRFERIVSEAAEMPRTVFALEGAPGAIRVGGSGGVVVVDGDGARPLFTAPKDRPWMTTGLVADGDALWIGSIRTGLARWRDGAVDFVTAADGLSGDSSLALHLDEGGALWIGTFGGGLVRRAPDGAMATLRARDGLCEDVVYSILADRRGALWLGGNRGVCRVERRALERRLTGEDEAPITPRLFGVEDGLRAGETSGGPNRSAFADRDGRLWFATPAGAAVVDPERLLPPPAPPAARIDTLLCAGAAIALRNGQAGAALPPAARGCELRFHAAELGRLDAIRLEYRVGEDDWLDAGESRSISFGGLGPGEHEAAVRARVVGGETGKPATVAFEVAPRLHESPAARTGALAVVAFTAWGFYRLRTRALHERRERLELEVAARTRELRQATDALGESNATLEQRVAEGIEKLRRAERLAAYGELVASVAHEVRQPVFGLKAAAYMLAGRVNDQPEVAPHLRTIELETRRIGTLMGDLLDFARPAELQRAPADTASLVAEALEVDRAEQGEDGPAVTSAVASGAPNLELDRARIVQVLVNLIGNARKHARRATRIAVLARPSPALEGGLRLEVEDDGAGLADAVRDTLFEPFVTSGAGSGLGLAIVRRIVEQHGGTVLAETASPHGVRFAIDLPASG